ncbi:MAG: RNA polymerase sigma factor [Rubrivivax sp.]|nr:RNA polymerase sigma factor [Rubrivivax sp.]
MMSFVPWNRPHRLAAVDSATLVAQLAEGDAAALDELYRREAGPVYRYALALGGNAAWAADATQEAFVALATRPTGFDAARGTLGAYLAGVARHALAALWRAHRHEAPLDDGGDGDGDEDGAEAGAAALSPEQTLVRAQDSAQVWSALRRLPPSFREAVVLVDLQERPYAEAARIAGIEINTLRTRLHRARGKLATLLGAADRSRG